MVRRRLQKLERRDSLPPPPPGLKGGQEVPLRDGLGASEPWQAQGWGYLLPFHGAQISRFGEGGGGEIISNL